MKVEPLPKPKIKKKRAKNNPVPTIRDFCYKCGAPYASTHEVFFGKNRQKSIQWGMQIKLCEKHHTQRKDSIHKNPEYNLMWKQVMQEVFEKEHGHERFMQEFGRNYLGITLEEFIRMGVA